MAGESAYIVLNFDEIKPVMDEIQVNKDMTSTAMATTNKRKSQPSIDFPQNAGSCIDLKRRSSCHRCGNMRRNPIKCVNVNCPQIFCSTCVSKLLDIHGPDTFKDGCPVCSNECCCFNKSVSCNRQFHCYRKCPASKQMIMNKVTTTADIAPQPIAHEHAEPIVHLEIDSVIIEDVQATEVVPVVQRELKPSKVRRVVKRKSMEDSHQIASDILLSLSAPALADASDAASEAVSDAPVVVEASSQKKKAFNSIQNANFPFLLPSTRDEISQPSVSASADSLKLLDETLVMSCPSSPVVDATSQHPLEEEEEVPQDFIEPQEEIIWVDSRKTFDPESDLTIGILSE